jgi:DNA helicase-2/ATP-dependent DNA helicase PcrA
VSQPTQPSRFINDIAPEYLVLPEYSTSETQEFNDFSKPSEGKATPGKAYYGPKRNLKKINSQPSQSSSNLDKSEGSQYEGKFKPGMLVEHNRFGRGKILELENAMPDTKAKIEFQKYGEKQLLLKFAKLKIIS